MWPSTTMPALAIVLSALSFIPSTLATVPLEGYGRDDYPVECAQACSYAMPSNLDCPEYAGMTAEEKAAAYPSAACFANDTSYLTSIAYCIHSYCPKTVKIYKIEYFWEVKMIYNSEALTIRWSYPEALAQVNITTPPKPMSPDETVFNRTISIDATTYQSYMNGVKGNKAIAKNESMYSILAFMTCVMVPIGFSLLRFLPLPSSWRSKFYGYFIDPPAWGRQHSVATLGIGMVPTRGQALFILYLIAINCLATFAGYPNYAPNAIFPDRHYELMRHIGNRAGSVAFANIPVVILYAGRSSVLLRLTNWSYSTFLLLHRWTATICVVQVALHSLLWLRIMIEGDSYPLVLTYPYWYVGVVGTVAFSALIPFSMLPIRKIMYEVFLITHIVLTIGALVGSWYHIVFLYEDKGGYEIWLIIAFAFWGLERLLRILRVSRYGIKKAYVTRIDDKYLRIDIPDVDAHGHCFAYFPTLSWRVWENHPFSIVNCSKGQLDGESLTPSSASHTQSENEGAISPTEASASKEMGGAMSNIRQLRVQCNATKPGITLFVQNLRGMTAKLAKKADTGIAIPVLIESSYGHEDTSRFEPNTEYPNTLVISGGVGIAGALSSLQASLSMYAKPLGTTKLYWGIKSKGLVEVVRSMIVGGHTAGAKEGGESSNWGHIETHVSVGERMDIKRVLTTELENAIGGTTVVVCGPHAMCDEARYAENSEEGFSTGRQTDKNFIAWKQSFANEMYFVPGIDATLGFWESQPAWWQYGGDIIYGASIWESAWPEVHGTNEGDLSKDIKVMVPLQKKAIKMLQYKNANDGPESHHFGYLWREENTDAQPNQHASPDGSDHTALQSLYSAFIHAWAIPQEPNGTDAGQEALHWALVVPVHAAGFTVDVMSNGNSIGSKVLQTGLNYGTVEDGIEEGTQ
ncbi:ferric reductase Fre2p [Fusarium bulbicola]|nr:ferric reductase Fre2p [Fusarium bulbicola]